LSDSSRSQSLARLLPAAEWLMVAALLLLFVMQGFIPGWQKMNTDFPNYYLPALLHHQGVKIDRAYEWRWFQRHKDYAQIDQPLVGFVPNPPLSAAPLLPMAWLPSSLDAKRAWLLLDLVLLAISLALLRRLTELGWRRLLLLTFLCVLPLRENFLFGQYYVVILALICFACYAACRGYRFSSGALLALAAWFKIFPAFFAILFLRKRNWRALAGVVAGGVLFGLVSILIFGWPAHRILLLEVLPRALHGELVSPFAPQWNSFTALCHWAFLAEPELNPAPVWNSPAAYAVVQALISCALLFSFLFFSGDEETAQTRAWEWSTFTVLLLLASSMPASYHHCVLIFAAIVAVDHLLSRGERTAALVAVVFYAAACSPMPGWVYSQLQGRLGGVFLLYLVLLWKAPARSDSRLRKPGAAPAAIVLAAIVLAAIVLAVLALSNLRGLRHRDEDFSRRIMPPPDGYGTFAVVRAGNRVLVDEMVAAAYAAMTVPDNSSQPMPGDVLAIAGSPQSPFVYFDVTKDDSKIYRLPVAQLGMHNAVPQYVADGHDPAISADGRWLGYLRDERSVTSIYVTPASSPADAAMVADSRQLGDVILGDIMEMSVADDGDVIVSAGSAADPHLVMIRRAAREIRTMSEIHGPVRYPAISPDGKLLAFSRRESGAWHLFVRELETRAEQGFTSAACNATSPAWEDARTLLYVSDCGRGLGLGAPARVTVR
jgi:hypothetical protein